MYSDVMVIAGRAVPVDDDAWSNTTIAAVYPPADVRWFKKVHRSAEVRALGPCQGGSDGSGRHSAAPMLTAIMSGGVGISGKELSLSC